MVLFRHNLPQPTQAQLMRGEFPETLCIEQGVVLSCRFAESKVRWTSRVLWMAVVSQSSVKKSRRNSASSGVGSKPFLQIIAEVATTTSYCCAQRGLATSWFGGDSVANDRGSSTSVSPSRSDTDSRCYLVFTRCLSRWKRSVSVSLYPW